MVEGPLWRELDAETLAFAAASRRVVVLADAINQFERTDRMLSLSWLPDPLPRNVRLLATAIPGPETEKLRHRSSARITELPPFTETDIEAVAAQVYGRYHRKGPAEARDKEIMWQELGTRDLPRFARCYALPASGGDRLAEYLLEESRAAEHPLLAFVRAAITAEEVAEEVRVAVGKKLPFDLHSLLSG
jgi:hypothetical protein